MPSYDLLYAALGLIVLVALALATSKREKPPPAGW